MDSPFVSLIMACYNVSRYVQASVESILSSGYENLEIICVDDGSTDDTLCELNLLAQKDSRVKVVNKTNGGAGSARNLGIELATGMYVSFPDADDIVKPGYINKIVAAMEHARADYCVFGYERYDYADDGSYKLSSVSLKANYDFTSNAEIRGEGGYLPRVIGYGIDDVFAYYSGSSFNGAKEQGMAWRCFYKLSVIKDHALRFKEGRFLGEDRMFNSAYCLYASRMIGVDEPLYEYHVRKGGLLRSSYSDDSIYQNKMNLLKARNEINELSKRLYNEDILNMYAATNVLAIVEAVVHAAERNQWKMLRRMLKTYCSDPAVIRSIHMVPLGARLNLAVPLLLVKIGAFFPLYLAMRIAIRFGVNPKP